ncbi:MAG: MBL fold metallo-hydrolase [Chromatiaceae bacterium]
MTAPEERQPDVTVPGHLDSIGACRSLTVTSVSEIGWWSTERLLDDIKSGGGAAACQWGMHFDPDNAAGSCTLLEVEDRLGKVTRILLDAGWNPGYMSERLRATGVDRLLEEGGVDLLFLTHEHLDHFWGIEAVLRLAPEITFLVPGTISDNGLAWLGGGAFPAAGIENRVPHRGKVVRMLPGGVHRLADGVASVTFDVPILLDIRGEQSIYVNIEERGLVCVTGCCHQGVRRAGDCPDARAGLPHPGRQRQERVERHRSHRQRRHRAILSRPPNGPKMEGTNNPAFEPRKAEKGHLVS